MVGYRLDKMENSMDLNALVAIRKGILAVKVLQQNL